MRLQQVTAVVVKPAQWQWSAGYNAAASRWLRQVAQARVTAIAKSVGQCAILTVSAWCLEGHSSRMTSGWRLVVDVTRGFWSQFGTSHQNISLALQHLKRSISTCKWWYIQHWLTIHDSTFSTTENMQQIAINSREQVSQSKQRCYDAPNEKVHWMVLRRTNNVYIGYHSRKSTFSLSIQQLIAPRYRSVSL